MNISYCRFRNTLNDLQDCYENVEEYDFTDSSEYENQAFKEFFQLCQNIVDDYDSSYGYKLEKKQLEEE